MYVDGGVGKRRIERMGWVEISIGIYESNDRGLGRGGGKWSFGRWRKTGKNVGGGAMGKKGGEEREKRVGMIESCVGIL